MSFVTRCPACTTQFRVVADQLKISDGWVRCGHCGEVFDAAQDLSPWVPPPETDAAVEGGSEAGVEVEVEAEPEPMPGPEVVVPEPEPEPEPVEPPPEPEPEPVEITPEPEPASVSLTLPDPEPAEPEVDVTDVSFVRQARRRAYWRRPGVRVALVLGSLVLVGLLGLQWVIHERHRIAALRPDLKPVLDTVCRPLGCTVDPLRWIAALAIESSTLVQRGNGRYSFEVVMRNASVFELAMPALELSLTDARDQLLLRRVLLPTEWSGSPGTLAPQDSRTLKLALQVDADTARLMAGYRTVAFYP